MHQFEPLFRAADGGGGGGPVDDGGGGAPSGESAPFKLTDDSMVDLGDGKAGRWGDLRGSRYMPRDEYDRGMQGIAQGREFLLSQAQRLEQAWQAYQRGQGPRPQEARPTPAQLLEEARSAPIIDGQTLHKVMMALHEQGLSPIAQLLAQQQAKLSALEQNLGTMRQSHQTLTDQHSGQVFEALMARHGGALGEVPGFHGSIDANEPAIRELLKDIWLSHNQSEWTDASFLQEARARIQQVVDYVRRADRQYVTQQKEEKRQRFFNNTRGNGTPSGPTPYVHKKGIDIAREAWPFLNDRNQT